MQKILNTYNNPFSLTKICPQCKQEFTTTNNNHQRKFCTRKCRTKFNYYSTYKEKYHESYLQNSSNFYYKNLLKIKKQRHIKRIKNREHFNNGGWKDDPITGGYIDKKGYVKILVGGYDVGRHIINWARANGRLPINGRFIHHKDPRLIFDTTLQCLTKNDHPSNLEERPHDDPTIQHDLVYIHKIENELKKLKQTVKELEGKLLIANKPI